MLLRRLTAFICATILAAAVPALADSRLEARYTVTLTGITVGKGVWMLDIGDDGYASAGSARVSGPLRLIAPGEGSAAARGNLSGAKVVPQNYSLTPVSGRKTDDVRMTMAANVIKDFTALPPPSQGGDRVPITEEHKKGVVDPMSAALMPVTGNGDLMQPQSCNRTIPIFDGRHRYDIVMGYQRTEQAKDMQGYSGPLIVCRVAYQPVAGHRAERKQVLELKMNQTILVWLAPVAGTRVLVPARVSMDTMFGTLIVQATQFSVEPRPRQAARPPTK